MAQLPRRAVGSPASLVEPMTAIGAVDVADRHGHPNPAMPNVAASRRVNMVLVVRVVPVGAPAGLAAVDHDATAEQECCEHDGTDFRAIHL